MKRCLYRAEGLRGKETATFFQNKEVKEAIAGALERYQADYLSLFACGNQLFLYYECLEEAVTPDRLLPGAAAEQLAVWPGEAPGRRFVPLVDIFHYQQPLSAEHWRRSHSESKPYGRMALLKPEEIASYIFYHYQYQEEQPGDGDKYGIIGLHEHVLFFYVEEPATRETPPYAGKLQTAQTPPNWSEVMEPHFQKWPGAPEGQELWRNLELLLTVRASAAKEGTGDA